MAYLESFRNHLKLKNFAKVVELWHEYCHGESLDPVELRDILLLVKQSELAKQFGMCVEDILPQVLTSTEGEQQLAALQFIYDLQTSNSNDLRSISVDLLTKQFGAVELFAEKLRLVGLTGHAGPQGSFQGAISNFLLLNHLQKGNFVLHTAGWGVGVVTDVSFLREQALVDFERFHTGPREVSFASAFKTLMPIPRSHFLSRRFSDADALEREAREDPAAVVRLLLEGLGPKTAGELKDELIDLVIPDADYQKWWQQARTKLKKDTLVESPDKLKEPFRLRSGHASWEERLEKAFAGKTGFHAVLTAAHGLLRDFPELLKIDQAKERVIERLEHLKSAHPAEQIQLLLFLEQPCGAAPDDKALKRAVVAAEDLPAVFAHIELPGLKRRLLGAVKAWRSDWEQQFGRLLLLIDSNQLRDVIARDLEGSPALQEALQTLLTHPKRHPEALFWYCQKEPQQFAWIEASLVLLSHVERNSETVPLAKKIAQFFTAERFLLVRQFFKSCTIQEAKEFLLLASKCGSFGAHDQSNLRSLAEVAHPRMADPAAAKNNDIDSNVFWTTQVSFNKAQERIKHLGTVEICSVAKEIEAARALGDLRENAEYKSACERRSRLQGELKVLADHIHSARIITPADVPTSTIGIGSRVELLNPDGKKVTYSILGAWEADADQNVLSFQSKLAQAMLGKRVGDRVSFRDGEFAVAAIGSCI